MKAIILNCEQSGQLLSSIAAICELDTIKGHEIISSLLDMWDVHIEIVAALHHAEGAIKRQWLIDAVEISCVSSYPSNVRHISDKISSIGRDYLLLLLF